MFKHFALLALSCVALTPCSRLAAEISQEFMTSLASEGVTVDLSEPEFCEGELQTVKGGVITGPDIRIQARNITYKRVRENDQLIFTIDASQDLMLEFHGDLFTGERLQYDFQSRSGVIFCGRTYIEPWFVGGKIIRFCEDGSYEIDHAFITTSEGKDAIDWEIKAEHATLAEERYLSTKNVQFRVGGWPLFWLPSFSTDLEALDDHPIRYTAGWGGRQGPRAGIAYEVISWENWKVFARFDYRLRRGPGGGLETYYTSPDRRHYLETINYIARDVSIFNTHERTRYRFQGAYENVLWDDKFSISLTYDKLSDEDMASDYDDQSLELEPSQRTELEIRRQEDYWIANIYARVRLNDFETVKQELPTFYTTWKPISVGKSGIITDNQVKLSYLDFVYANNCPNTHSYSSSRLALTQRIYRPFTSETLNVTPQITATEIYYGNSPSGNERWLATGIIGCDVNTSLYRFYNDDVKHVIIPYANYQYFTFPTTTPDEHYIFDIDDGWYRLNMVRFGTAQGLYVKNSQGYVQQYLTTDIYSYGFINVDTIPAAVPKVYMRSVWNPTEYLRHTVDTAWDCDRGELDHFNLLTEWTINADFAISAEFRHRDAFDWRKVDRNNFILDAFRTVEELRHSALSDRRDTALLNFFYRYHPNWAIQCETLWGWNRENHSRYTEFEVDLLGTLRSSGQVKLAYQHRESDDRVAIYFSLGSSRPDRYRRGDCIPRF